MNHLRFVVFLFLMIVAASCKKDLPAPLDLRSYFPSEPGTEWYYQNYVLDSTGFFVPIDSIDTVRIVERFDMGDHYQITILGLHGTLPINWLLYADKFTDESGNVWLAFEGDTVANFGSLNTAFITHLLRQDESMTIDGYTAELRGIDRIHELNNPNYPFQPGYTLPVKFAEGIGIVQYEAKLVSNPFWFRKQILGFYFP